MIQKMITGGQFETEADAWDFFDRIAGRTNAFAIHSEVEGDYIQPLAFTEHKSARVDRLLIPLRPAIEAGWCYGAIAVEGKRSGAKAGRLLTQALDYTRCVFQSKHSGIRIIPSWVFVWPWPDDQPMKSALESILTNNRVGFVSAHGNELVFNVSMTRALRIFESGDIEVGTLNMGNKRGSR